MKLYVPVGLFGIIGAVLRYALGIWSKDWWPHAAFPGGTLIINLTGCLLLGWFSTWAAAKPGLPAWFRTGFGTGLVGAYTTFSTFSVETVTLLRENHTVLAVLYAGASFFGGLLFAGLGYAIYQAQTRRQRRGVQPL